MRVRWRNGRRRLEEARVPVEDLARRSLQCAVLCPLGLGGTRVVSDFRTYKVCASHTLERKLLVVSVATWMPSSIGVRGGLISKRELAEATSRSGVALNAAQGCRGTTGIKKGGWRVKEAVADARTPLPGSNVLWELEKRRLPPRQR